MPRGLVEIMEGAGRRARKPKIFGREDNVMIPQRPDMTNLNADVRPAWNMEEFNRGKIVPRDDQFIGSGHAGAAYVDAPQGDVLKEYRDASYDRFLNIVRDADNPHFPRATKSVRVPGGRKQVIVEQLKPLDSRSDFLMLDQMSAYKRNPKKGQSLPQTMKDAIDILRKGKRHPWDPRGGDDWDLHRGNVMKRPDGTLVIIDPFVDRGYHKQIWSAVGVGGGLAAEATYLESRRRNRNKNDR